MSTPLGSSQFFLNAAQEAGQSLRFEDGDSAYMTRTPTSAGNRKTWTWSGWVKRGNISANQGIFGAESSGDRLVIGFGNSNSDQARFYSQSPAANIYTNAVFRDVSAWYHVVWAVDTTQSTAADRVKLYINGTQITSFASASYPSQNSDLAVNNTVTQYIGRWAGYAGEYLDGYLANVCFIDGTALDPTSFGEYDGTLWRPKSDADITGNLTFGTNGFYLPFKQTTSAEGFSTVTYSGNGSQQSIEGVGFEPDLVWMKGRTTAYDHQIYDSVRGATERLRPSLIEAESTQSTGLTSFDSSGFTLGSLSGINNSSNNYVAWCWDAGSGSAVSNTDGTITSSVKANTAKGFSIATYTGDGTSGSTFGHGLGVVPELIIVKRRNGTSYWNTYTSVTGATKYLELVTTATAVTATNRWNNTAPTSSVVTLGNTSNVNGSGSTYVAYSFASVSGYSSIGSYTGTGSAGNSITGLGFKPAWVMVKRTDSTSGWSIYDNTRTPINPRNLTLSANLSNAEVTSTSNVIDFDNDGFTLLGTGTTTNASGGTYIYMAFADTRDATFFGDTSGNSNNWTPNALNNTDVVPDSPVTGGNFATLNPLTLSQGTLYEGNLRISSTAANRGFAVGTQKLHGKVYFEVRHNGGQGGFVGIGDTSNSNHQSVDFYDGTPRIDGSAGSALGAFSTGDICGVAVDIDTKSIQFFKNGSSILSTTYTTDVEYFPYIYDSSGGRTMDMIANFGQDSSFAGNETPQGNTDDNGVGDFYYAPPSGYLALTTGNLPAATITAPDDYFNTVLYTGNGTSQSITGVGFSPDVLWLKERSSTSHHQLMQDIDGGTPKFMQTSSTIAEVTDAQVVSSFDTDGFSVGNSGGSNQSGQTYVGWNWYTGATPTSNTDGTITSTVSANTTAGFSVVSYVGNFTAGATVGHGLSATPEMIIIKNRDGTQEWIIYHASKTSTGDLRFDTTTGTTSDKVTGTSSSTFTVAADNAVNSSSANHIAYCFHSVESYSKCGVYTGNGSSDGPFVHCGFRPAFVMLKVSSTTENWVMFDNERSEYNLSQLGIYANSSGAEVTISTNGIDMLSNGFKLRGTGTRTNGSGQTYIFLAFAEAPFKSANAR